MLLNADMKHLQITLNPCVLNWLPVTTTEYLKCVSEHLAFKKFLRGYTRPWNNVHLYPNCAVTKSKRAGKEWRSQGKNRHLESKERLGVKWEERREIRKGRGNRRGSMGDAGKERRGGTLQTVTPLLEAVQAIDINQIHYRQIRVGATNCTAISHGKCTWTASFESFKSHWAMPKANDCYAKQLPTDGRLRMRFESWHC